MNAEELALVRRAVDSAVEALEAGDADTTLARLLEAVWLFGRDASRRRVLEDWAREDPS